MGLTLITPATAPAVTRDEVKQLARVLDSAFDGLFDSHIAAAQEQVEKLTALCLSAQTWRLTLDSFSDAIELPKGPVVSATVQYYDTAGVLRSVDPASYTLDLTSDPQWIVLNSDAAWPEVLDGINAVRIDFTAGFAGGAPAPVLTAVRALVVHWFESGLVGDLPAHIRTLLFPYIDHGF